MAAPRQQQSALGLQLGAAPALGASGGLQLGQLSQAQAATAGGLQLGQVGLSQANVAPPGGLQLGQLGLPQTSVVPGGLQLGQLGPSVAPGGLQLGQLGVPQASTAYSGLQLGQIGLPQASVAPGGLQLGQLGQSQASAASGGLQLGLATSQARMSMAYGGLQGLGLPQASTAPGGLQLGLGLGTSQSTASTASSGLQLGQGLNASQLKTSTASSGLQLGQPLKSLPGLALQGKAQTTESGLAALKPSRKYTFRQLEDQINKWSVELENQEKVFLSQAKLVCAWDRLLAQNGDEITELNEAVQRVKDDQGRLEGELELIGTQQGELEELLGALEEEVQVPAAAAASGHHADLERTRIYGTAEKVDSQLKRMAVDLRDIIEQMNAASSSQDEDSTVSSIVKVLSAHADSLNWIDRNAALLQQKLEEVGKNAECRRREQERAFRTALDGTS